MEIHPNALFETVRSDLQSWRTSHDLPTLAGSSDFTNRAFTSVTSREVAAFQLEKAIVKKFEPTGSDISELGRKAKALFRAMNNRCQNFVVPPSSDLVNQMRFLAERELGECPTWQEMLQDLETGPGASIGSRGRNSALEKLFTNAMTTTNFALYGEYASFLGKFPSWVEGENLRKTMSGQHPWGVSYVGGTKLTTVRKNSEIDRTINTEASLNMLFQKALSKQFDRALMVHYGYSAALQPDRNAVMACKGSLTSGHCTIDLTSASDCISLQLIEAVLPRTWVAALKDCRSDATWIDGELVNLYMLSPMGNGFTFSVMTYVFSLLIKALCLKLGEKWTPYKFQQFGVFGDDIVVPQEIYEDLICALESLGFIPNLSKSFASGHFRESCGSDWYRGENVRGVYCKRLASKQDVASLLNRLLRWSARWGIFLNSTVQLLLGTSRWPHVPPYEADTAGIHVPAFMARSRGRYWCWQPERNLIRLFRVTTADGVKTWALRPQFDNPWGVVLAASAGWLDSDGISRRTRETVYRRRKIRNPSFSWDTPDDLRLAHGLSYDRWSFVVWSYLQQA